MAKDIHDVGDPRLMELQIRYDETMACSLPPFLSGHPEQIQITAEQESKCDPVRADKRGFTAGLMSILLAAANTSLMQWRELRTRFDVALQPFITEIDAIRNMENDLEKINDETKKKEEALAHQAEADPSYVSAKQEMERAAAYFSDLSKRAGDRPIQMFARSWWYILILFGITSIEWKINFDFFQDWVQVPAVAAGFTIAMALGVAVAAHAHGEFLKQRNLRFGAACEHIGRNYMYLLLATIALILAVGVAGWARYTSVLNSMSAVNGPNIGDTGSADVVSPLTSVYVSLGINLIVWLVGLIVSFMSHDEDDELMKAYSERRRRVNEFDRKNKQWKTAIQLQRAQAAKKIDELRRSIEASSTRSRDQRTKLEQVEVRQHAMYQQVATYLMPIANHYKSALVDAVRQKNAGILVGESPMSPSEYGGLEIPVDANLVRILMGGR